MNLSSIAIDLVRDSGLPGLSREAICEKAGIPLGSFSHVAGCSFGEFLRTVAPELPLSTAAIGRSRIHPELRRRQLLACAIELAKTHGYNRITRKQVAELAGVSEGNVARLYTMPQLREEVLRHAIDHKMLKIVAQGLASCDPICDGIAASLKRQALAAL